MKKIIALLLIFSAAFLHINASAQEKDLTDTLDFLSVIGWGEDYTAQTIQADREITKAVFVENVAFLMNESKTTCDKLFYHDVPRDHWAFNYISRLTELGILNGREDKNFNPDEIISWDEAVKILVSAMGCNRQFVDTFGGYPSGYYKIANELELLKGCTPRNGFTMYDMMKLLENALKSKVIEAEFNGSVYEYKISDEETFMSKLYNLHYKKGVLTGCDGANILNSSRIRNNTAVIDGVVYETKLHDILNNIGCSVEYVYSGTKDGFEEKELVWIRSTGHTDTLELPLSVDKRFNEADYTITYNTEGARTKKVRISKGVVVIYNGSFASGNIGELLNKNKYAVKLIKSKNAGSIEYDIAVIDAYENYVVGAIDSENRKIYDKNDGTKVLSFEESEWEIISVFSENMKSGFDSINIGDVLSVFKSYDGKSVKVVISANTAEGSVEQLGKDDSVTLSDKNYICIENTKYYGYDDDALLNINIEDKVKLYLDVNGFVAYVQKTGIRSKVAYIIKATYSEQEERCCLKLMTEDGEKEKYLCSEKVKIDGSTYKNQEDIKNLFATDDKTVQQLVLVEFNDNEIRMIDTLTPNDGSDFKKYYTVNGLYRINVDRLGAKVLLDDNTKIFGVPSAYSLKDEDFSIRGRANLVNDTTYTADVYRYVNEELEFEQVLVMYDVEWNSISGNTPVVLVDKITFGVNEDNSSVEYLKGYQALAPVEYKTDGEYLFTDDGIKSGDIVRLTIDDKGNVKRASVVYSYKSEKRPLSKDLNASFRIACVYAHDIIGNALQVGYNSGDDFDEVFNMTNAKILVYDGKYIHIGGMDDIYTAKMRNDCSTIVAQTSWSEPIVFVVYLDN